MNKQEIQVLFTKFKHFLKEKKVLKGSYKTKKKEYVKGILQSIKRKNNLDTLANFLFSDSLQYNNVAGFTLYNSGAGQIHSPYIKPDLKLIERKSIYDNLKEIQMKDKWHYDMMRVLYNVLVKNYFNKTAVVFMSEEWHNENVGMGQTDEFVALMGKPKYKELPKKDKYRIDFFGNILNPISQYGKKCDDADIGGLIKFRLYQLDSRLLVINIHSSSNMPQLKVIEEVLKLLKTIRQKYKGYKIILGGDSNIYYGNVSSGEDGITNIKLFGKKLDKMGYSCIISRHIVAKYRPYNFFQNAQAATKGGKWTNEETMFIAFPKKSVSQFDNSHYMLVQPKLQITDFYPNYSYAFEGVIGRSNRDTVLKNINKNNFYNRLFSDHVPMAMIFENYNIIFSNNVSINSNRGINNNKRNFRVSSKKLKELSDKDIPQFFIDYLAPLRPEIKLTGNVKRDLNTLLTTKFKKGGGSRNLLKKIWSKKYKCSYIK